MLGRRVGNPINMRSAGGFPEPVPEARETECWAGGGTSSNNKSLKCPSLRATPNWPSLVKNKVSNGQTDGREAKQPTTSFIAKITAYLHFGSEGNDRDANFAFDARFKCLMDISGITGSKRTKNNENFTG